MAKMNEQYRAVSAGRRMMLPLSLMLNLFLAAVIGGHILLGGVGPGGEGATPLARALASAEAMLPTRDAAGFGAVIRRDAPNYADAAKQLAQARDELDRRIIAEPFDKGAVRQAMAEWQAKWNRFVDGFSVTLVDALSQVSAEGRRKLVDSRRQARFMSQER